VDGLVASLHPIQYRIILPYCIIMSRRHGKGEVNTPSSVEAAGTSTTISRTSYEDGDDDGEKSQKLAKEAIKSIQDCYKMCFANVLADVVITMIDHDIWTKLFHPTGPDDEDSSSSVIGWIFWMDLVDSFSFFFFACGLWRISHFYIRVSTGDDVTYKSKRIKDEHISSLLRTMSLSWGIVAFNFAFVAVSEAAALPEHGRDGPFHFLLNGVSSKQAALGGVGALVLCGIAASVHCSNTARLADLKDNKRISMVQQQSKANLTFASTRRMGYKSYRNQAFCAMAFALKAFMELLKWSVDVNGGILGRILSISDVLAPFAIAWLLFTLNKSFLRAAIARLRDDGTRTIDEVLYNDLYIKQTAFYEKVAETMKEA